MSGITPIMSIVRTALAEHSGRVVLLYANRDERSVIFAGPLAALADARAALDWAIREAGSRHYGIRVVYCEPDLRAWDGVSATMAGAPVLATALPQDGPTPGSEAAALVAAAGLPVETVSSPGSPAAIVNG